MKSKSSTSAPELREGGGSTTHRLGIKQGMYVNVSNGNLNCTLVVRTGQKMRMAVSPTEPAADTIDYIPLIGPGTMSPTGAAVTVLDLLDQDELWVRNEGGDDDVLVVRGNVKIFFGS